MFLTHYKERKLLLLKLSRQKIKVVEINAVRKFPHNNINANLSNSCQFHDARILGNKVLYIPIAAHAQNLEEYSSGLSLFLYIYA